MQEETPKEHNENIIVIVRVRPLNENEANDKKCITIENNSISIDVPNERKSFAFDYIADEKVTQNDIFHKAGSPLADACIQGIYNKILKLGYNATVFAYGQTGAGKTFSILGPTPEPKPNENERFELRGLMPRIFEYIFNIVEKNKQEASSQIEYMLKCSYLEIYQEQIVDLLDPQTENLHIREDIKKGVYVESLIEETVDSAEDLMEALKRGSANRHVGSTAMNKESSRSHSVFTLTIESKSKKEGIINILSSRFHIIDLAGSERQKMTDAVGERLKEAGKINKSLSALGNVINSIVDISQGKSRYVHYRDSKLTFLLKDSIGGNSKTVIIANISGSSASAGETLSTLNFAKRAKLIKNKAVINEDTTGTVLLLQQEIKRLKAENAELKTKKSYNITESASKHKEAHIGITKKENQLEDLLQKTIELRSSDIKITEQMLSEKDQVVCMLKKCIKKYQHEKARDKMILKLKESALTKLQDVKGSYCTNEEVERLKAENQALLEKEDQDIASIVKCIHQLELKEQLVQKTNEQNDYIQQITAYLKDISEEREFLREKIRQIPTKGVEDEIAKVKLDYGEKLEELSRQFVEYTHFLLNILSEKERREKLQEICDKKDEELLIEITKQAEKDQFYKQTIENYEKQLKNSYNKESDEDVAKIKITNVEMSRQISCIQEQKEQTIKELESKCKECEEYKNAANQSINMMEELAASFENNKLELDNYQKKEKSLQEENNILNKEKSELQNKINLLEQDMKSYSEKTIQLSTTIDLLKKQLITEEQKTNDLVDKLNKEVQENKNNKVYKENEAKFMELQMKLESQNKDYELKINNLLKQEENLKSEIFASNNLMKKMDDIVQENKKLNEEIKNLKDSQAEEKIIFGLKINELLEQQKVSNKKLNQCEEEKKKFETEFLSSKNKINELNNKIQENQKLRDIQISEKRNVELKVQELLEIQRKNQEKLKQSEENREKLSLEIASTKNQIKGMEYTKKENEMLKAENKKIKELQLDKVSQDCELKIRELMEQLMICQERVNQSESEREKIGLELASTEVQIKRMDNELIQCKGENERLKNEIKKVLIERQIFEKEKSGMLIKLQDLRTNYEYQTQELTKQQVAKIRVKNLFINLGNGCKTFNKIKGNRRRASKGNYGKS